MEEECYEELGWSLEGAFDESVLLWHLATDFCYHDIGASRLTMDLGARKIHVLMFMHALLGSKDLIITKGPSGAEKCPTT